MMYLKYTTNRSGSLSSLKRFFFQKWCCLWKAFTVKTSEYLCCRNIWMLLSYVQFLTRFFLCIWILHIRIFQTFVILMKLLIRSLNFYSIKWCWHWKDSTWWSALFFKCAPWYDCYHSFYNKEKVLTRANDHDYICTRTVIQFSSHCHSHFLFSCVCRAWKAFIRHLQPFSHPPSLSSSSLSLNWCFFSPGSVCILSPR